MSKWLYFFCPAIAACFFLYFVRHATGNLDALQIFDARHYLGCYTVFQNWRDNSLLAATSLRLNGPVMPALSCLGAALAAVTGTGGHKFCYLIMALLYVATVGAVSFGAYWLSRSRLCGALAGLLWGFYPPAAATACLFLTETPAALLIAIAALLPAYALALARMQRAITWLPLFVAGLVVALLAMTKTALVPGVVLLDCVALCCLPSSRRKAGGAIFALGAIIVLSAYGSLMWCFDHRFEILPSRDPAMNMAVGCDLEVQGWECKPMPFSTYWGSFQKPAITFVEAIKESPKEFLALSLKKLLRAWDMPWLVYGRDLLPRQFTVVWHCLLVALAVGCIIIVGCQIKLKRFISSRDFAFASLIVLILSHLVFVVFESQPRYSFTAMPLIVMLVVAGARRLAGRTVNRRQYALAAAICSGMLGLLLWGSESGLIRPTDREYSGFSIEQTLSPVQEGDRDWFVVFSARDLATQYIDLSANGAASNSPALSAASVFDFDYKSVVQDMISQVQCARGLESPTGFWDWYAVPLEREALRSGHNLVSAKFKRPFVGQTSVVDARSQISVPAPYYRSLSRLESSLDGLEMRPPVTLKICCLTNQSEERIPLVFIACKIKRAGLKEKWIFYRPTRASFVN